MLGCEGVYYKCPAILGPNMALPRSEMQKRIKEYLYEQLNTDDRGLTACLIIHTLNKDTEKVIMNANIQVATNKCSENNFTKSLETTVK